MDQKTNQLFELLINLKPRRSDAIVWLQGDRYDRGPKTVELFNAGWAPRILLTGNNTLIGPHTRTGENNISLLEMREWLVTNDIPKEAIMIEDNSFHTRDQAIHVVQLALRKKWKNIMIIGSMPHYGIRYFLTFLRAARELNWTGGIIPQHAVIANNDFPGGRSQTAAELFPHEMEKLDLYRNHVVTIEDGIAYLQRIDGDVAKE